MNKILKVVKYIVTLGIPMVALLVAVFSYRESSDSNEIARESNKKAEEALSMAKSQFETEKRPYLTIRSERFKESGKYIKLDREGNVVKTAVQFELKNTGQLLANDIKTPKAVLISRKGQFKSLEWIVSGDPLEKIALTPGEHVFISLSLLRGGATDDEIKEIFQVYDQGELKVPIKISVMYKSSIDNDIDYETSVSLTVGMSNVAIHETIIK